MSAPMLAKVAAVLAGGAISLGAAAAPAQAAAVMSWGPTADYFFGDWPVSAGPTPGVVFHAQQHR